MVFMIKGNLKFTLIIIYFSHLNLKLFLNNVGSIFIKNMEELKLLDIIYQVQHNQIKSSHKLILKESILFIKINWIIKDLDKHKKIL